MARLGLNIEKRYAQHNTIFRYELQQQGGKVTVPCLRIAPSPTEADQVQWLYESNEIIRYLQQRFEN